MKKKTQLVPGALYTLRKNQFPTPFEITDTSISVEAFYWVDLNWKLDPDVSYLFLNLDQIEISGIHRYFGFLWGERIVYFDEGDLSCLKLAKPHQFKAVKK